MNGTQAKGRTHVMGQMASDMTSRIDAFLAGFARNNRDMQLAIRAVAFNEEPVAAVAAEYGIPRSTLDARVRRFREQFGVYLADIGVPGTGVPETGLLGTGVPGTGVCRERRAAS